METTSSGQSTRPPLPTRRPTKRLLFDRRYGWVYCSPSAFLMPISRLGFPFSTLQESMIVSRLVSWMYGFHEFFLFYSFDEWKDPSEEALAGGRGMYALLAAVSDTRNVIASLPCNLSPMIFFLHSGFAFCRSRSQCWMSHRCRYESHKKVFFVFIFKVAVCCRIEHFGFS